MASFQLDRELLREIFGEVNVRRTPQATEVRFSLCVMPQGGREAGWQTGIALDASASMLSCYGRELVLAHPRGVPEWLIDQYRAKGWISLHDEDGCTHAHWTEEAGRDAVARGYLRRSKNIVNPLAQRITASLAGDLDADGRTTIIYWACGDGGACEVFGDFTAEQCRVLNFAGPKAAGFGTRTYLLPALRFFCDRFAEAPRGIFLFITDGRLDDMGGVVAFTRELAAQIESGARKPVKCVLLGFGDEVDERQLRTLDDLNTGTGVDVWDHKLAKRMDSLVEIYSEVACEHQIVAPSATIYDASGQVVADFPEGLPAQVSFRMGVGSDAFELAMAGGGRTRQVLFRR
jgi:hypothetical protein